jgi:hypothetical protein
VTWAFKILHAPKFVLDLLLAIGNNKVPDIRGDQRRLRHVPSGLTPHFHQGKAMSNASSGPVSSDGSGKAIASLVLGIVGMVGWCLPIIGLPVTIVGLVLGIMARTSSKRGMAIAGIVLSIIGLALSVVNGAMGVYLLSTGQNPLLHK